MLKKLKFAGLGLLLACGGLQALPSAASGKNLDTTSGASAAKRSVPEFEIVVDPGFASPANWQVLHRRIQEQNRQYQESRRQEAARGGVDLGGGVSVVDPKTGKRRLLDFVEPDDWTYVDYIPVGYHYILKLSDVLVRDLGYEFFSSLNKTDIDPIIAKKEKLLLKVAASALANPQLEVGERGLRDFFAYLSNNQMDGLSRVLQARVTQTGRVVRWVFVDFPLEQLNDEGFIRLVDPETKRQVAIQKDGVVIIQRAEHKELDDESQAGLYLHEGVLFSLLMLKPEIIANQGTAPVRKIVRRVFAYERAVYDAYNNSLAVDPATIANRRMALDDAIRDLVKLGF